jgi:hypothetical protein
VNLVPREFGGWSKKGEGNCQKKIGGLKVIFDHHFADYSPKYSQHSFPFLDLHGMGQPSFVEGKIATIDRFDRRIMFAAQIDPSCPFNRSVQNCPQFQSDKPQICSIPYHFPFTSKKFQTKVTFHPQINIPTKKHAQRRSILYIINLYNFLVFEFHPLPRDQLLANLLCTNEQPLLSIQKCLAYCKQIGIEGVENIQAQGVFEG